MTLDEIIEQGESILAAKRRDSVAGEYVPFERYDEWKRVALMYAQQQYPGHPQVKTIEEHVSGTSQSYHCQAILSIMKAFREIQPQTNNIEYESTLGQIFDRFNRCAQQLKRRHEGRATLSISDEYDVQDLLQALLKLHFDDVRAEEYTPSYAGGASRIDFLLKEEEIAIEVKKTRKNLRDDEIGEQLIIDIAKYKNHPNCKSLYCFVYDPDGNIRNPKGLTSDLEKLGEGIKVKVYIRPED